MEKLYANLLRNFAATLAATILVMLLGITTQVTGQTNPAAFNLSTGSFSFTSQTATNTTYPTNMQGWPTSANNITTAETNAPGAGDLTMIANGLINTSGLSNLGANGFQFISTGNGNGATSNRRVGEICVALNTTGRINVLVTWTASDQQSGSNYYQMGLALQYRIGTSGTFTTVSGTTYQSAASSQAAAHTFTNIALPVACENQAIVQIRWIYYQIGSSGSSGRDPIRLDDITVASSPIPACSGAPTAGTAGITPQSICSGTTASMSVSGYSSGMTGITLQWQQSANGSTGWANVTGGTGATTASYTTAALSTTTFYRCAVTCSSGPTTSYTNNVEIDIVTPTISSVTNGIRCGTGTVALAAAGNGTLNWYAAATGGASLGTGTSFTTPSISATTEFYVSSTTGAHIINGARLAPASTSNITPSSYGLVFDVNNDFTLNSVDVYNASSSGTMVIQLQNSSGTALQTSGTFTVPTGTGTTAYTAALGWAVPVGTGYRLLVTSGTASLVREGSLGGFPYALGTVGSITSGYISGTSTTYYYLYNWSITTGCESPRTSVMAIVNPAPAITASATPATVCDGSSTNLTVSSSNGGYTYTWSAGTSPSTGASVSAWPTFTTTYTVNASDNTGGAYHGCVSSATVGVSVSVAPSDVTVSPGSATICAGSVQPLVASGGAAPNPNASAYLFTASAGTFTPLSGGTNVSAIQVDDAISGAIPIGFSFTFSGSTYTNLYASSNGFISFNASAAYMNGNSLTAPSSTAWPLIAPLWDDLNGALGTASYLTTGSAGNRIFTFEWLNWEWYYTAGNVSISMQVKLYEATGKVEMVYRQEANAPTAGSASIGLVGSASGNYLSLNGTGTNPTASSTTETSSITGTRPATGQTYAFRPPLVPITWSSPNNDLYSDAGANTHYVPGTNLTTVFAKPTSNTTYTVTATGSNGCTKTGTSAITVNTLSTTPSITGNTGICPGGSTTLTASGGVEGTFATTNWFTGLCDNAFTEEWFTQPYILYNTFVNSDIGGVLNINSTDINPRIQMYSLGSFDPAIYKYIQIRYRVKAVPLPPNDNAGNLSIYYINTLHSNPDPSQVVSSVINYDGDWHILNLDMTSTNWNNGGHITGWRFDWCSVWGVNMEFDYIRLGAGMAIDQGTSIVVSPSVATNYYAVRSGYCNTTACAGTSVSISQEVGTPVFALGATSAHCSKAETVTYGATSINTSGITYTLDAASLAAGNTIVAGTGAVTYTAAWHGSSIITASAAGCAGPKTATHTVTVNETPSAVTITPMTKAMCSSDIQELVSSGGNVSSGINTLLDENFNGPNDPPIGWTKINNSYGGNPALADWTLEPDGFSYYGSWHSNDNSQFYISNSDAQGSNGTTSTILISKSFSTLGFTTASVSFYHYFYSGDALTAGVDYSTDGSNWTNLKTYFNDIGSPDGFIQDNALLPVGEATVYVRFTLDGDYGYFWAIDNVKVIGNSPNTPITWTPVAGLYSNPGATAAYVLNAPAYNVYAHPTVSTIYTATATSPNGCKTEGTAELTVTTLPVANFSYAGTPYCSNATNPLPTLDGAAGTFTAGPGLSINATSGLVSLTGSTAGSYTVANTINPIGGCPQVIATNNIEITTAATAAISYSGTPFCKTVSNAPVTLSGTGMYTGGAFTALPSGLSIDPGTGEINPGLSLAGNYTVTYAVAAYGGCGAIIATTNLTITALPVADLSYAGTPYLSNGTDPLPSLVGAGGVFSASPAGLVFIGTAGQVDLSASTLNTYTVTNAIAAAGGCNVVTATTSITISAPPTKSLVLIAFIEGLYVGGGMMHEALDFNPVTEDFPMKWGTGVADTVTVALYDKTYSNLEALYHGVYLKTDGSMSISVNSTLVDLYYITIFPRNGVPITTATPQSFAGSSISYDFATPEDQAYGAGAYPQKDLGDGFFGMYSGELDHDSYFVIDGSDVAVLDPDIISGPYGYLSTDLNGDGVVDGSDMAIMDANSIFGPLFWNPFIEKMHGIINK